MERVGRGEHDGKKPAGNEVQFMKNMIIVLVKLSACC